ncbi:MAG: hypothetical protein AAF724_13845 [Pseudomonadota bacterium]
MKARVGTKGLPANAIRSVLIGPGLFAEPREICDDWAAEGLLSFKMEAPAVVVAAGYLGTPGVPMPTVRDAQAHRRIFFDPLKLEDEKRLKRLNENL